MEPHILAALALVFGASVINAAYTLPMRLNRQWAWENSWFAFSILGLVVVPTLITLATVPALASVYSATPASILARMAFFGLLWGVCMVFFGLAIPMAGLAITFAVSLGTSAACGSILPLLMNDALRLVSRQGMLVLLGLAVIIAGVTICGAAGWLRERREGKQVTNYSRGFFYALGSGVLGSMLNLGLASGGSIQEQATANGAGPAMMSNAVWLPCVYAGFLPGVFYCLWLMRKNGTTGRLLGAARWYYWLMAALMGALWFGSIVAYSVATVYLGSLGPVIGWPLFMSAVVIVSMFTGLLAGEWSRTGTRPIQMMAGGIGCLVGAIAILSYAAR